MFIRNNNKLTLFLITLVLSVSTAFSQQTSNTEEDRLREIVFEYFNSKNDTAFYQANSDFRNYTRRNGNKNEYYKSWSNEIIYDINHDYYYQALIKMEQLADELRENNDKDYMHVKDYLMGVFYGTRDNNDLCKQYLRKALEQTNPEQHNADQIAIYQMLINTSIFQEGDQGLEWADKAIAICKDNFTLCGTLSLKSMLAFTHGYYDLFNECYNRIETIRKEHPDENLNIYHDYTEMARSALDGDFERAIQLTDSLQSEVEKYNFQAVIYKLKGDQAAENQALINLLNARERRNNEISTLTVNDISHNLELNQERNEKRKAYIVIVAIAIGALCIIIGLLVYFGRKQLRIFKELNKQNRELRRTRDRAEETERMKTAFIRNVSHQIRTPLNAISGFSSILAKQLNTLTDAEKDDMIERIEHNTAFITRSLNYLIALSDVESVRVPDKDDEINCNAFCQEIADEFKPISSEVRFSYNTFLDDIVTIKSNKIMLKSVIEELLDNANKFTSQGRILLQSRRENSNWIISVSDTGEGIKEGQEDAIFGHFVKVNDMTEGMGVGLTFCKNIVLQLGGNIALDKKYRNGSRFIVTIPLKS